MTALLFLLSASAAGLLVLALTWRKAGIPRTLLAATLGVGLGFGVAMLAAQQLMNQEIALAPRELFAPLVGAFIAASWSNRRHHELQQEQQKS